MVTVRYVWRMCVEIEYALSSQENPIILALHGEPDI